MSAAMMLLSRDVLCSIRSHHLNEDKCNPPASAFVHARLVLQLVW
jgi:hypothetical protein